MEGVGFAQEPRIPVASGSLFGVVVGAVLVVRRRWPIAVVLVSIAITPAEMGFLIGVVGLYTLAASEVPRRITARWPGWRWSGRFIVTVDRRSAGHDPQSGWGPPCGTAPMFAMALTSWG